MKITKYRIVKADWSGYEVQVWRLWFPFWVQTAFNSAYDNLDSAKRCVDILKDTGKKVVWKDY